MNERREELARRLLDQPASAWPEEMKGLRVELKSMPAALRSRLDALTNQTGPAEAPVADSPPTLRGNAAVPRVIRFPIRTAAFSFGGAVAAMVLVYFGLTLRTREPAAKISFAEGDVRVDQRALRAGDELRERDRITLGPESTAVLNAGEGGLEVRIRLRSNSQLSVEALRQERVQMRMGHGSAFVSLSNQQRLSQPLSLTTQLAEARVAGTVFALEANAASDSILSTFEGTVIFRRRWADLEDLPEELLQRSDVLRDSRQVFVKATARVSAGSTATVSREDFDRRAVGVSRLQGLLAEPALARLRGQATISESDIRDALDVIDRTFRTAQDRTESIRLLEDAFGTPPDVTTLSPEEAASKRVMLEEQTEAERDSRYRALLADGRNLDRETFRLRAAQALGKAPQEVVLKNGEKLFGTVFGKDGKYQIYTASGSRVVDPEEIEEIKFE